MVGSTTICGFLPIWTVKTIYGERRNNKFHMGLTLLRKMHVDC